MTVFANRSLRTRLVIAFAAVATLLVLVVSVAVYRAMSSQLVDVVDAALEDRLVDLASDVRQGRLDDIAEDDRLTQVTDLDGTVLVSSTAVPEAVALLDDRSVTPIELADYRVSATQNLSGLDHSVRIRARVVDGGDGSIILIAGRSLAAVDSSRRQILNGIIFGAPLIAMTVVFLGWLLLRQILQPVQRMAHEAAARSATGTGMAPLGGVVGDDEFAGLASAFNELLSRIEVSREHERSFIADVSHELRTPLAVLRGELELAILETNSTGTSQALRSALAETDRMTSLIERLLFIARADSGHLPLRPMPTDLSRLIDGIVSTIPRPSGQQEVTVRFQAPDEPVNVDPDIIIQILNNLISNALRHARTQVLVTTTFDAQSLLLRVDDDGNGFPEVPPTSTSQRFAPGTSETRATNPEQFGLGLSIVRAVTNACGGVMTAGNGDLGGARVEIRLPRS